MRSPIWAALAALVALAAGVTRWLMQGSGNVYTATTKRFYIPDPDLGWRVADGGPVWIGLEAIAIIAAVMVGVAFAGWLLGRWERKRSRRVVPLRVGLWLAAAAPLALPLWAFSSGFGPDKGREQLPVGATAAAPTEGIEGSLELPAGRYTVVPHAGTAVTARVAAGKETFDARFGKGVSGTWTADPGDLTKATTAELELDPRTVDTGIALRSEHARDEYLQSGKYPRIKLRLDRLIAARQDGPGLIAFRAQGALDFLGDSIATEITGNLRAADAAARQRLGFAATDAIALVDADLAVTVSGTALRSDADSFDSDRIPIHVSLVLRREP